MVTGTSDSELGITHDSDACMKRHLFSVWELEQTGYCPSREIKLQDFYAMIYEILHKDKWIPASLTWVIWVRYCPSREIKLQDVCHDIWDSPQGQRNSSITSHLGHLG